ncbi:MAG: type 4a pilus biogenesis protein PilO [Patescibacteria group bacterium]
MLKNIFRILKNPWFIIITTAALLIILVIFIVLPAIKEIKSLNKQILNQRALLESRYEKRLNIKNAIKNYNSYRPRVPELLASVYLNAGNEIEFITALEKISEKNSLEQKINFDTENGGENQSENTWRVPIDIQLSGNYLNILRYLEQTEKLNFYLVIDRFSVSPKTSDFSGNVRAVIGGHTFWKKLEK